LKYKRIYNYEYCPTLENFCLENVNIKRLKKEYGKFLITDYALKFIAVISALNVPFLFIYRQWAMLILAAEIALFFIVALIKNIYFKGNDFPDYKLIKALARYEAAVEKYKILQNKRSEQYWYSMDGKTFETEIAKLFESNNYKAELTKDGADGGVDILLYKDNKKIAVQCKAHKNKISESVARDLYGVLHAYNFDSGILVALSGVSSNTREFCESKKDRPIKIMCFEDITELVK